MSHTWPSSRLSSALHRSLTESATLVPSLRLRRTENSTWSPVSRAFPVSSPSSTCSNSLIPAAAGSWSYNALHAEQMVKAWRLSV